MTVLWEQVRDDIANNGNPYVKIKFALAGSSVLGRNGDYEGLGALLREVDDV